MKKNNYATKDDLKEFERSLKSDIKSIDNKMEETKNELVEFVKGSEERILGELQKMRDNDEAHKFSHQRINEEIEELQKAIKLA